MDYAPPQAFRDFDQQALETRSIHTVMVVRCYYLDTCIWLNLFQKETGTSRGVVYWRVAQRFLEQTSQKGGQIVVSTIVLKELFHRLGNAYPRAKRLITSMDSVRIIRANNADYDRARRFEAEHGRLSFYDYLHVAITHRIVAIFVTRDRALLSFANLRVVAVRPEELLS